MPQKINPHWGIVSNKKWEIEKLYPSEPSPRYIKNRTVAPAAILFIKDDESHGKIIGINCVYGNDNSLIFRCPNCGNIHAHGAGNVGGDSDGRRPSPHCSAPYHSLNVILNGERFCWELHELFAGDDITLAGTISYDEAPLVGIKKIIPQIKGELGWNQNKMR